MAPFARHRDVRAFAPRKPVHVQNLHVRSAHSVRARRVHPTRMSCTVVSRVRTGLRCVRECHMYVLREVDRSFDPQRHVKAMSSFRYQVAEPMASIADRLFTKIVLQFHPAT